MAKEKKPTLYLKEGEKHPQQKKSKKKWTYWDSVRFGSGGDWSPKANQVRNHRKK